MAITLKEAKALEHGDYIHHITAINATGSPQRFRVNGRPKTWKTRPDEVRVPLKRGMYQYGYLNQHNMHEFSLGYGS